MIATMTFDPTVFAQYGLLGIILAWFMWRLERKLDSIATVINDFTVASLLETLSRETLSDHLRSQATEILKRVSQKAHDAYVIRQAQAHMQVSSPVRTTPSSIE